MTNVASDSVAVVPIQDGATKVQPNGVGFMAAMFVWLAVLVGLVYWVG